MKKTMAALMAAILIFTLSGCEKPMTPGQTVSKMLDAVKALDRETAAFYIDYDRLMDYSEGDNLSDTDETTRLLVANLSYKILSEEQNENTATVKAEITNLDLKPVFSEYVKEAVQLIFDNALSSQGGDGSEEDLREKMQTVFIELLKKQSETTTAAVDLSLVRENNVWKVRMDDALQDAVFGGLSETIRTLVEENANPD